nr:hypothetical protein [Tanacetum cinerariifolium]
MSVRTKRGLGLDKYIRESELGINYSKFSIFHTKSDELEGNAEGKGILKSRPTGKPVNPNRPKPVSAGRLNPISAGRPNPISAGRPNHISADQPNPVSAGQPNTVSASDGILGPGPLNIQSKSTYFHSSTHNNQQIFCPITHNSLYSLYLTGGLNGKTAVKPSAGNVELKEDKIATTIRKTKKQQKFGTDSKAMVVVDVSIDWDKQTEEGNTEPRSLENFGMVAGLEIASDANSEGEVISANDAIPAAVSVSTGPVAAAAAVVSVSTGPVVAAAAAYSLHSKTEFAFICLSTE